MKPSEDEGKSKSQQIKRGMKKKWLMKCVNKTRRRQKKTNQARKLARQKLYDYGNLKHQRGNQEE